jgi:hypothetical protein
MPEPTHSRGVGRWHRVTEFVAMGQAGPQLDRFGLLLLLVATAIVGQSLIDVSGSFLGSSVRHASAAHTVETPRPSGGAR